MSSRVASVQLGATAIGLHSSCCICPTASGTFHKMIYKISRLTRRHTWYYTSPCRTGHRTFIPQFTGLRNTNEVEIALPWHWHDHRPPDTIGTKLRVTARATSFEEEDRIYYLAVPGASAIGTS